MRWETAGPAPEVLAELLALSAEQVPGWVEPLDRRRVRPWRVERLLDTGIAGNRALVDTDRLIGNK